MEDYSQLQHQIRYFYEYIEPNGHPAKVIRSRARLIETLKEGGKNYRVEKTETNPKQSRSLN